MNNKDNYVLNNIVPRIFNIIITNKQLNWTF